MACERTATLVADHFDDTLVPLQREALDQHARHCADCAQALDEARQTHAHLRTWQPQRVPAWSRPALPSAPQKRSRLRWAWWQWAPLAVSCVLALAVVLNVQISTGSQGMAIRFGASSTPDTAQLEARLAAFDAQYQAALQTLTQTLMQQQATDNARLMEAVIDSVVEQFGDSTARSLEQVIAYFESQREQDLQLLQASYQQLADSDYATIRSVEQLAMLVQGGQP
jgi:hypothetical protein